ncbi:hypothetical protein B0T20DRAFT_186251 [Sordaria brevicollis]|uniref:Uncharacterized protein n=1 Tax=Sordaria brevicollis TaxID=83679 RepID=A0AAE0PFD2_SORBR|nr:hypothetical protein B0T20DRAFT_186251 [Sordaria brevicollis]
MDFFPLPFWGMPSRPTQIQPTPSDPPPTVHGIGVKRVKTPAVLRYGIESTTRRHTSRRRLPGLVRNSEARTPRTHSRTTNTLLLWLLCGQTALETAIPWLPKPTRQAFVT